MAHASRVEKLKLHMKKLKKAKIKARTQKRMAQAGMSEEEIQEKLKLPKPYQISTLGYDLENEILHHSKYAHLLELLNYQLNTEDLTNDERDKYLAMKEKLLRLMKNV